MFSKVDGLGFDDISDSESVNVDQNSNDEASSNNADDQVFLSQIINVTALIVLISGFLR